MQRLKIEGNFKDKEAELEDTLALKAALEDNLESADLGCLIEGGIAQESGQFYILMSAPNPELVKAFLGEILIQAELEDEVDLSFSLQDEELG